MDKSKTISERLAIGTAVRTRFQVGAFNLCLGVSDDLVAAGLRSAAFAQQVVDLDDAFFGGGDGFVLIGASGAGKTQVLFPLLADIVARGEPVVLYDFKGDYKRKRAGDGPSMM